MFEDILKKVPKNKRKIVIKAYEYAKKAHEGQYRISGEPYIFHPLAVAEIVADLGFDYKTIQAALLHDVIEDSELTEDDLKKEFGEEVASIVGALTKIKVFSDKRKNNIEALKKILLASVKDIRVIMIKLADRLHNMRTLKYCDTEKQKRISDETFKIYVPIAQKLGLFSIKWELEDLSFKYLNPEMYNYIKEKVGLKREEREEVIKRAINEIRNVLLKNDVNFIRIIGRPKSFYSIFKKIKDKGRNIENIYDLYAVRVITKEVADCYSVLYALHNSFTVFPNRLKDYIAIPKANGYQSLHTLIFSNETKMPIEVQIRTEEMHKVAEFGVAAHWRYKDLKKDKLFDRRIDWLREVLEWSKQHDGHEDFYNLLKFNFFYEEIFVFTPKNDVIILPEGSTPVDFAYSIHTEVGNRAVRAKINGVVSSLDSKLKNGDIVEIITDKNARPQERWLTFVRTSKARLKIRESLKLRHSGKPSSVVITGDPLDEIEVPKKYKKVKKAGCCTLTYGKPIVGVLNKNNTLVIHNADCDNAKYTLKKKIALDWKKKEKCYVYLNIVSEDRIGLLMDILSKFNEYNVSIREVDSKVTKDNKVRMKIKISEEHNIDKLIQVIKKLDGIVSVTLNKCPS